MSRASTRRWICLLGMTIALCLTAHIGAIPALAETQVSLRRDRGLAVSYWPEWQIGDEVALRYQPSQAQFPFTPTAAQVDLHAYEGAGESTTLMAVLYTASEDGPGLELAATLPLTVSFAVDSDPTVTLLFDEEAPTLVRPQPLYLAVRYAAGSGASVASLWFDATAYVLQGACWYRQGAGPWREHNAFWVEPDQVGYPMMRLFGETSGPGIGDVTEVEAEADTMLVERIPDLVQGQQTYLQVGSNDVWDGIVSLVRFPFPDPPITSAVPVEAGLILFHYQVTSETVQTQPISVTVHAVTSAWEESTADWESMAGEWDELVLGQAVIPAYDEVSEPRDYYVSLDVTDAAMDWWGGEPIYGLALTSTAEAGEGLRHLGSREREQTWERPVMQVTWDLNLEDGMNRVYVPHVSR